MFVPLPSSLSCGFAFAESNCFDEFAAFLCHAIFNCEESMLASAIDLPRCVANLIFCAFPTFRDVPVNVTMSVLLCRVPIVAHVSEYSVERV